MGFGALLTVNYHTTDRKQVPSLSGGANTNTPSFTTVGVDVAVSSFESLNACVCLSCKIR